MAEQKTESHSDQMIDIMNDSEKSQVITLKEATEILKLHNEWRRGAEIGMGNVTRLGEAIDFITQYYKDNEGKDTFNNNFTKPNFVEKREEQAWAIIEGIVEKYVYDAIRHDAVIINPYDVLQYLKLICHPPMLKNNDEGLQKGS